MAKISAEEAGRIRARLKRIALRLRQEIRETLLRSDEERCIALAEQARDAEEAAFADLMVDVNFAEISRDLDELREVNAAVKRLAEGTYGICATCAEDIDPKRLSANPEATRCFACQSALEQSQLKRTLSV